MELAWKRQQEREAQLAAMLASGDGAVIEVEDLDSLGYLLEAAGSSLVVLLLYSRSCGVCKQVVGFLETLSAEVRRG
jgi:hypothetical protein